ncbi:MAG: leucine-rich repeat protein [Spirochaetia bacterium]
MKKKLRFALMGLVLVAVILGCPGPGGGGPSGPTYTVTYNANGTLLSGNTPVDSNTYHEGDTVTVAGNIGTMVMTGNNFAGWTTNTTGPGLSYAAGATFTMGTSNVALYCVWIPSSLTFASSGTTIAVTGWSGAAPSGLLTIPEGVTGIGGAAFENCTALTGVIFPSSVTSIADSVAFGGCTGLTSVTFNIPSSLTYIGYSAFYLLQ